MRLRWRLRTLLVAVAVAGLALGLAARRQRLLDVAARHYRLQTHGAVRVTGRIGPDGRRGPFYRLTALGLWHWEMGQKYERAACTPWLPVAPDPPPPE